MKRILLSLFFACALAAIPGHSTIYEPANAGEASVYVCMSSGTKRYHCDRGCGGLNNCKHEIRKVSVSKAKSMGLTPCKKCY
jgi:hypothetical protein